MVDGCELQNYDYFPSSSISHKNETKNVMVSLNPAWTSDCVISITLRPLYFIFSGRMWQLFAFSIEANFGSWSNIDCSFLYSFLCCLRFGGVANWLFEEIQLDAQYQSKGSPYDINGLCYTWSNFWNHLPTDSAWECFATNRISAVICFVLVIAFHLLGFANLFFCNPLLSLLYMGANILEIASA